jgi:hypothetical protein
MDEEEEDAELMDCNRITAESASGSKHRSVSAAERKRFFPSHF